MSRNGGDVLTRELLMKSRRPTHGRTVVVVAVVAIGDAYDYYPNSVDEHLYCITYQNPEGSLLQLLGNDRRTHSVNLVESPVGS